MKRWREKFSSMMPSIACKVLMISLNLKFKNYKSAYLSEYWVYILMATSNKRARVVTRKTFFSVFRLLNPSSKHRFYKFYSTDNLAIVFGSFIPRKYYIFNHNNINICDYYMLRVVSVIRE